MVLREDASPHIYTHQCELFIMYHYYIMDERNGPEIVDSFLYGHLYDYLTT